MTTAGNFLARLVSRLTDAGIPSMLTGSFASTYHGTPRTTHDLDLVVDVSRATLRSLLNSMPEDEYYFSQEAAFQALEDKAQFNIIDLASGWKADLIVLKDREFSRTEFGRRQRGVVLDTPVSIATAEDTILAKLEWARRGQSERQLRDVAGILAVSTDLDEAYLDRWVNNLGLRELWQEVRRSSH